MKCIQIIIIVVFVSITYTGVQCKTTVNQIVNFNILDDVCASETGLKLSSFENSVKIKTCNYLFSSYRDIDCKLHHRTSDYEGIVHEELLSTVYGQKNTIENIKNIFNTKLASKNIDPSEISGGFVRANSDSDSNKAIVLMFVGDNGTGKSMTVDTITRSFYRSYVGLSGSMKTSAVLKIVGYLYQAHKSYINEQARMSHASSMSKDFLYKIGKHIKKYGDNSIVVIDEVQKMMHEVFVSLESFFDGTGVFWSKDGKTVTVTTSNVIFLITSDFGVEDTTRGMLYNSIELKNHVNENIKKYTTRDNFNKYVQCVVFTSLDKPELMSIVDREIVSTICTLLSKFKVFVYKQSSYYSQKKYNIKIDYTTNKNEILAYFGDMWYNSEHLRSMNGRSVQHTILPDHIYPTISQMFASLRDTLVTTPEILNIVVKLGVYDSKFTYELKYK
jgi:hypothetical protein